MTTDRKYFEAVITVTGLDEAANADVPVWYTKVYRLEFEALTPSGLLGALARGECEHFKLVNTETLAATDEEAIKDHEQVDNGPVDGLAPYV